MKYSVATSHDRRRSTSGFMSHSTKQTNGHSAQYPMPLPTDVGQRPAALPLQSVSESNFSPTVEETSDYLS
ncbi:MAG: hypothetical protein LBD40_02920 [Puniceicoccales bacterium]|nr:hypothetical protein [Puniceicoccales bacterium]